MTKKEILASIDYLTRDLDEWNTKRTKAILNEDEKAYQESVFRLDVLIIRSHQELTCLRDYIEENIKEDTEPC